MKLRHAFVACIVALATSARPHIIMILADDFGWANADWHRPAGWQEAATPIMSKLVRNGIELNRHYAYKFCSPSRSAIQSGRNPIHVNVQNLDPLYWNPKDEISGFAGIPRNMTGLGAVMRKAGYSTHFVGKWDAGMATESHTPHGRGYDSSLLYFHHLNDYWDDRFYDTSASSGLSTCAKFGGYRPVDLWHNTAPATGFNNSQKCTIATPEFCFSRNESLDLRNCPAYPTSSSGAPMPGCQYEDALFAKSVHEIIRNHNASQPIFLFWATHIAHAPLEVPMEFLKLFAHVDDWRRRRYLAMVYFLDTAVGNLVASLKANGMWNNTLLVFSSDNGGPIYRRGSAGANNWPLRGGKASNWEGGIRVNAFVSGGRIPKSMRGRRLDGLSTVWDWYATFAALGGVDPTDHQAAAAGLPPIDSMNMWPYLSGAVSKSPRKSIALGSSSCVVETPGCINEWGSAPSRTTVEGIIVDAAEHGIWKLVIGRLPMAGWQGPQFPNATTLQWAAEDAVFPCAATGCLFRLDTDPGEHGDLAAYEPVRTLQMIESLRAENRTVFSPDRGQPDLHGACEFAMHRYGGFWGPWVTIAKEQQASGQTWV